MTIAHYLVLFYLPCYSKPVHFVLNYINEYTITTDLNVNLTNAQVNSGTHSERALQIPTETSIHYKFPGKHRNTFWTGLENSQWNTDSLQISRETPNHILNGSEHPISSILSSLCARSCLIQSLIWLLIGIVFLIILLGTGESSQCSSPQSCPGWRIGGAFLMGVVRL